MTCIVAVKANGHVYMGADSAGVSDGSLIVLKTPKLFRRNSMLFGYTTSFRMGQLLQYSLIVLDQPSGMSDEAYMTGPFISEVKACFKDGGYHHPEDEDDGGTFLVGYHGRIWRIEDAFAVLESWHDFDAIGGGEDIALGALHASNWRDTRYRLEDALKAAEAFSADVRGPFHFLSTED